MTRNGRKQAFLEKSNAVLFDYAIDTDDNRLIGYCISVITDDYKTGEVESICLDERYRKSGIGKKLIENAVLWFDSNSVETQKWLVGVGNSRC
jgi:ribosomal protein S18 acetylase RimI-like enzyme